MSLALVRNGVSIKDADGIEKKDIWGACFSDDDWTWIYLFLTDAGVRPEEIPWPEMGPKNDILSCPSSLIPASDEERNVEGSSIISSIRLDSDEILPLLWAGGEWKAKWLVDLGIATLTGKVHVVSSRAIPIMRLAPEVLEKVTGRPLPKS